MTIFRNPCLMRASPPDTDRSAGLLVRCTKCKPHRPALGDSLLDLAEDSSFLYQRLTSVPIRKRLMDGWVIPSPT